MTSTPDPVDLRRTSGSSLELEAGDLSFVLAFGPTEDDGFLFILESDDPENPGLAAMTQEQIPSLVQALHASFPEAFDAALGGEKGVAGGEPVIGIPSRALRQVFTRCARQPTNAKKAKAFAALARDLYAHICMLERALKGRGGLVDLETPGR